MLKKAICCVVAFLFLFNNIAYGLSPMPGTDNPGTRSGMYALGQKLFAAKRGPGAINFDKIAPFPFTPGRQPVVEWTEFVKPDYDNPPAEWGNNPLLKETDLLKAFTYFRDNEAKIPAGILNIEVGRFEVKDGELPISCVENSRGGYTLMLHEDFVRMWNDIRKNDVWFNYTFPDGKTRTLSVAWGMFYRVAKHEMGDLAKRNLVPKNEGHINYSEIYSPVGKPGMGMLHVLGKDKELKANMIEGRYNIANDAIWAWFLGSYCFTNLTRYDNDILKERLRWFFEGKEAQEMNLNLEFPNLLADTKLREHAIQLALGINFRYFAKGAEAIKIREEDLTPQEREDSVKREREYQQRRVDITDTMFATGGGETPSGVPHATATGVSYDGLRAMTRILEKDVIDMIHKAGSGHPGGSLSMLKMITALYFGKTSDGKRIMRYDPKDPNWVNRDRFVLSKGHAAPGLYAALGRAGFFPVSEFDNLRKLGSMLQGHTDMTKTPGIDMSAGSLGVAISAATGMAIAAKMDNRDYTVNVMLGDGEVQEGQVDEAARHAAAMKLDNIIAFLDWNGMQIDGKVTDVDIDFKGQVALWQDRGWNVITANGESVSDVIGAIETAKTIYEMARATNIRKPTIIIAKTIKGSGLPGMNIHGAAPKEADVRISTGIIEKDLSDFAGEGFSIRGLLPKIALDQNEKQEIDERNDKATRARRTEILDIIQAEGAQSIIKEAQRSYAGSKNVSTRTANGDELLLMGAEDPDVVVMSADLKGSVMFDKFEKAFGIFSSDNPKGRYIPIGIREAHMASLAAGLAACGKIPVIGTFSIFTTRMPDQLNAILNTKLPVVIVGTHGGLATGPDGRTHQDAHSQSVLGSLPGLKLLEGADAEETRVLTRHIYESAKKDGGIYYIRPARLDTPILQKPEGWQEGAKKGFYTLFDSEAGKTKSAGIYDIVIVSTGVVAVDAVEAAKELANKGKKVRVVNVCQLNAITDSKNMAEFAGLVDCGNLVTVIDALPEILGDRVNRALVAKNIRPGSVNNLGIKNFGESGKPAELYALHGLDKTGILNAAAQPATVKAQAAARNVEDLLNNIRDTVQLTGDSILVTDRPRFVNNTVDYLALEAALSENPEVKASAQRILREVSLSFNVKLASIHDFYTAKTAGKWANVTVPAVNGRTDVYNQYRQLFRAAREKNVGALVLELARSEMRYAAQDADEFTAVSIAAAIRQGYKGLVFIQGDHYQVNREKYDKGGDDREKELNAIETLIRKTLMAGMYNIDLDPSTLVDESALKNILKFENDVVDRYLKIHPELAAGLDENGVKSVRRRLVDEIEMGNLRFFLTPEDQLYIENQYRLMHRTTTEVTMRFIRYIRKLEKELGFPEDVYVSIGIEERHIDKPEHKNNPSTVLGSMTLARTILSACAIEGITGPSKLSLQTGTMHGVGGEVDFGIYRRHLEFREKIGLAVFVQHGASTLEKEDFDKMREGDVGEVHLATEYQKIELGLVSSLLPQLGEEMAQYLTGMMEKDAKMGAKYRPMWELAFGSPETAIAVIKADDSKRDEKIALYRSLAEEQSKKTRAAIITEILGDTMPKGLKGTLKDLVKELPGPFKRQLMNLPEAARVAVDKALYEEFSTIFEKLGAVNTKDIVEKIVPFGKQSVILPSRPKALQDAVEVKEAQPDYWARLSKTAQDEAVKRVSEFIDKTWADTDLLDRVAAVVTATKEEEAQAMDRLAGYFQEYEGLTPETAQKRANELMELVRRPAANFGFGTGDDKPSSAEGQSAAEIEGVRSRPYKDLGKMSIRLRKAMIRLRIDSIGDILTKTAQDFLGSKQFGNVTLAELRRLLANYDLALKGERPWKELRKPASSFVAEAMAETGAKSLADVVTVEKGKGLALRNGYSVNVGEVMNYLAGNELTWLDIHRSGGWLRGVTYIASEKKVKTGQVIKSEEITVKILEIKKYGEEGSVKLRVTYTPAHATSASPTQITAEDAKSATNILPILGETLRSLAYGGKKREEIRVRQRILYRKLANKLVSLWRTGRLEKVSRGAPLEAGDILFSPEGVKYKYFFGPFIQTQGTEAFDGTLSGILMSNGYTVGVTSEKSFKVKTGDVRRLRLTSKELEKLKPLLDEALKIEKGQFDLQPEKARSEPSKAQMAKLERGKVYVDGQDRTNDLPEELSAAKRLPIDEILEALGISGAMTNSVIITDGSTLNVTVYPSDTKNGSYGRSTVDLASCSIVITTKSAPPAANEQGRQSPSGKKDKAQGSIQTLRFRADLNETIIEQFKKFKRASYTDNPIPANARFVKAVDEDSDRELHKFDKPPLNHTVLVIYKVPAMKQTVVPQAAAAEANAAQPREPSGKTPTGLSTPASSGAVVQAVAEAVSALAKELPPGADEPTLKETGAEQSLSGFDGDQRVSKEMPVAKGSFIKESLFGDPDFTISPLLARKMYPLINPDKPLTVEEMIQIFRDRGAISRDEDGDEELVIGNSTMPLDAARPVIRFVLSHRSKLVELDTPAAQPAPKAKTAQPRDEKGQFDFDYDKGASPAMTLLLFAYYGWLEGNFGTMDHRALAGLFVPEGESASDSTLRHDRRVLRDIRYLLDVDVNQGTYKFSAAGKRTARELLGKWEAIYGKDCSEKLMRQEISSKDSLFRRYVEKADEEIREMRKKVVKTEKNIEEFVELMLHIPEAPSAFGEYLSWVRANWSADEMGDILKALLRKIRDLEKELESLPADNPRYHDNKSAVQIYDSAVHHIIDFHLADKPATKSKTAQVRRTAIPKNEPIGRQEALESNSGRMPGQISGPTIRGIDGKTPKEPEELAVGRQAAAKARVAGETRSGAEAQSAMEDRSADLSAGQPASSGVTAKSEPQKSAERRMKPGKSPKDALVILALSMYDKNRTFFTLNEYLNSYKYNRQHNSWLGFSPLALFPKTTARLDLSRLAQRGILEKQPFVSFPMEYTITDKGKEILAGLRDDLKAKKGLMCKIVEAVTADTRPAIAFKLLSELPLQVIRDILLVYTSPEFLAKGQYKFSSGEIERLLSGMGIAIIRDRHGRADITTIGGIKTIESVLSHRRNLETSERDLQEAKRTAKRLGMHAAMSHMAATEDVNDEANVPRPRAPKIKGLLETTTVEETVVQHPLIKAISDADVARYFVAPLGKHKGPGVAELSEADLINSWQTVTLLNSSKIQILTPQRFQVGLTEAMERALKNVRNRVIAHKAYSSEEHLAGLLAQRTEPGVMRIVITEQESRKIVEDLNASRPDLFRGVRLSNMLIPDNYGSLPDNEKTFCQARIILTAILMRLYEKDQTPMIEHILTRMLAGCVEVDERGGIIGFLNKMAGSADETTEQAKSRIMYCLEKTVSLVAKVAAEMEHIRLLMKEVWSKA